MTKTYNYESNPQMGDMPYDHTEQADTSVAIVDVSAPSGSIAKGDHVIPEGPLGPATSVTRVVFLRPGEHNGSPVDPELFALEVHTLAGVLVWVSAPFAEIAGDGRTHWGEQRRPGRPAIGPKIEVRLPLAQIEWLDDQRGEASRAEMIRRLIDDAQRPGITRQQIRRAIAEAEAHARYGRAGSPSEDTGTTPGDNHD